MKWINNAINISNNGRAGECPYCNSANTDYSYNIVQKKSRMGFGVIWCNDCKKAFWISRMEVEKEHVKDIKHPRGCFFSGEKQMRVNICGIPHIVKYVKTSWEMIVQPRGHCFQFWDML